MKQVTNSLLTLYPMRSTSAQFADGFPRDEINADGRRITPFHIHREEKQLLFSVLPGRSCPPRSFIHSRLGEGRIRSLLQTMSCPMIAALIILISVNCLYGTGAVQVQLKEEAHVRSGKVLLKDIASIEGTDAAAVKNIGSFPIIDAPEFGAVKTFSRHQIEEIIFRAWDASPEIRISGAPIVQITLQGRRITAQEIVPVLKAFIMERTPWLEQEIEVYSIKNLEKIEVPAGEFDLRISDKSPVFGKGKILVSFDAVRSGKSLTSFWMTAGIRVHARILTARKRIPYGKVMTPDDIALAEKEIEDPESALIREPSEVIGKVTKRSFSPGDPLNREALMKPFLVKSGDTVQLRLERNGLILTSQVTAAQDGRLGQVIKVRNLEFSSVLKARVTGRAQVEMP